MVCILELSEHRFDVKKNHCRMSTVGVRDAWGLEENESFWLKGAHQPVRFLLFTFAALDA